MSRIGAAARRCPAAREGELRRGAARAVRKRVLRPLEGCVHRRASRPRRPLRTGRRRDAVPRRGRRNSTGTPGEAASRPSGRRAGARRRGTDAPSGCPHHRRHQPRPPAPSRRPGGSGRTCTTGSASSRSNCRPCGNAGKISRFWPSTFSRSPRKLGRPKPRLTLAAVQQLQRYHWPGNVRELQHVIERGHHCERYATDDRTARRTRSAEPGGAIIRAGHLGSRPYRYRDAATGSGQHPRRPAAVARQGIRPRRRRRTARNEIDDARVANQGPGTDPVIN